VFPIRALHRETNGHTFDTKTARQYSLPSRSVQTELVTPTGAEGGGGYEYFRRLTRTKRIPFTERKLTPAATETLETTRLCRGDETTAAGLAGRRAASAAGLLALAATILCGGAGNGGGEAFASSLGNTAS